MLKKPTEHERRNRRARRAGISILGIGALAFVGLFGGPASEAVAAKVHRAPAVRSPQDGQRVPARPVFVRLNMGSAKLAGARLNGRKITNDLLLGHGVKADPCADLPASLTRGATCHLQASPSHGLRYGRNVLRARFKRHGSVRVRTVHFRVARNRPLAAAGRDWLDTGRRHVHLNGRKSLMPPGTRERLARSGKHARLRYRWHIVHARGSHGKLRGAHTATPVLKLGRRAEQTEVRLTVTSPFGLIGNDTVTVVPGEGGGGQAETDLPPAVPVDTLVRDRDGSKTSHIQVGEASFPGALHAWAQVVVLDRRTLVPVSGELANKAYFCHSHSDCAQAQEQLSSDLAKLGNDRLVIVSNPITPWLSDQGPFGLEQALSRIGVGVTGLDGLNGRGGGVTAIGVPGTPPGEGDWHSCGCYAGGGMQGYLVRTNAGDPSNKTKAGDYVFAPSDHVDFNTNAAGSTDSQNVMEVGGQKFTQTFDGGIRDGGGFQVVVLNAQTLEGQSYWFETDHSDRQALDDQITAMRDRIHAANVSLDQTGRRKIVFIASLGDPAIQYYRRTGLNPDDSLNTHIAQLVNEVEQLGGTRNGFYEMLDPALYGNHGYSYSLLSESDSGAGQGQEMVGTGISGNGTGPLNTVPISGTLTRSGPDYEFELQGALRVGPEPSGRDPSRATSELMHIAFQNPTPWPDEDPNVFPDPAERARKQAAIKWIGLNSDLKSDDPRGQYWTVALKDNQFNTDKWDKVAFSIQGLQYPQAQAGSDCKVDPSPGFCPEDLDWAKAELAGPLTNPPQVGGEIRWLEETHDYMEDLATPVMRNQDGAWGLMSQAVANVQNNVGVADSHDVEAKTMKAIFTSVLGLADVVPEVGEYFYVFGDIYDLAMELTEIGGEPAEDTFPSTAGKLAGDLADRMSAGRQALVEQLPNVIAADYTKLKTVGSCAMLDGKSCPYPVRDWQYSSSDQDQATASLKDGTKLWAYSQLLPAKYRVFALPSWWKTQVDDEFYGFDSNGTVYRPFQGLPASDEFAKPIYRNIPYYTHKNIRGSGPGWSMTGGSDRWQIFTMGYLDGAGTYGDPWRMRWPTTEVTDPLFNQPDRNHLGYLGADPETFFDTAFGPTTKTPIFEHYPRPGDGVAWCYHLASYENCP